MGAIGCDRDESGPGRFPESEVPRAGAGARGGRQPQHGQLRLDGVAEAETSFLDHPLPNICEVPMVGLRVAVHRWVPTAKEPSTCPWVVFESEQELALSALVDAVLTLLLHP